jgi:hypothetical protein
MRGTIAATVIAALAFFSPFTSAAPPAPNDGSPADKRGPINITVEAWTIGPRRCSIAWLRQAGKLLPISIVVNEYQDSQAALIRGTTLVVPGWSGLRGPVVQHGAQRAILWQNDGECWQRNEAGPAEYSLSLDASNDQEAALNAHVERWWIQGGRCSIVSFVQDGNVLSKCIVVSESGDMQQAYFDGAGITVPGWSGLKGALSHRGPTRTISWINGTSWSRTDLSGGMRIYKGPHSFPVSISTVSPDSVSLKNEDPNAPPVLGYFTDAFTLVVPAWGLRANVLFTGTHVALAFDNSTVWEVPYTSVSSR